MNRRIAIALLAMAMLCAPIMAQDKTVSYWEKEGRAQIENASYEKALQAFDQGLKVEPENDSLWFERAFVLMLLDRQNESVAAYEKALNLTDKRLEENPGDAFAWQGRSVALSGLGRQEEAGQAAEKAIEIYDQEIEVNPKNATAWWYKGENLANRQRFEEALPVYEKVIELNDSGKLKDAWLTKATLLMQLSRYDESFQAFDRAIEVIPADDARNLSQAWQWKGSALEQAASLGGSDDAELLEESYQAFARSSRLNPESLWAWINMGWVAEKLGWSEEAARAFDNATMIDPGNIQAWRSKASALFHAQMYNESLPAYEKVIELAGEGKPNWAAEAWIGKGEALNESGRHSEAKAAYEKALQIEDAALKTNATDASAWLNKGEALQKLERYDSALQAYDEAIKNAPTYWSTISASAWQGKGDVLLKTGSYDGALEAYNRSIDLLPLNEEAWKGKTDALQELGRADEASFTLSLAGILGYKDRNAAKPSTVAQADSAQSLAERLLALAYMGESELEKTVLLPGRLPESMPIDLPIPEESGIVGSLVQGKKGMYIVLDSGLNPDQALQFYRVSMTKQGWSETNTPGESRGFSPDVKKITLCQGRKNTYLVVAAYPVGNGSDLRLSIYTNTDYSPCRMRDSYDEWLRPLPKLVAPAGSEQISQGFSSGGGNSVGTSAILKAKQNSSALLSHYGEQLRENGWARQSEMQNGSLAWSIWTVTDEDDLTWRGILWALDLPGADNEHFMAIEASVLEENASSEKMVWAEAGSGPAVATKVENEPEAAHSQKGAA